MYVGTELSEDDVRKLEEIKDHLSGGGKLKISGSAAIRYLIREYELLPLVIHEVSNKDGEKRVFIYPDSAD